MSPIEKSPQIVLGNLGSLITYKEVGKKHKYPVTEEEKSGGVSRCLGFLMQFDGKVYDATFGTVNVTPEQADTHNKLLDEAMIKGLKTCKIGQGNYFYLSGDRQTIKTFLGTHVATRVPDTKQLYHRDGMIFKCGRLSKSSSCEFFVRTA